MSGVETAGSRRDVTTRWKPRRHGVLGEAGGQIQSVNSESHTINL